MPDFHRGDLGRGFVPSTGKSSNSSSSSSAAAGFCWSLSGEADLSSATTALVVGVEPWAVADMVGFLERKLEVGVEVEVVYVWCVCF